MKMSAESCIDIVYKRKYSTVSMQNFIEQTMELGMALERKKVESDGIFIVNI